MGMMINRRRACGGKKSLLPSGYKQLEYIESTGTQYIDTGYKPNNRTTVEGEFVAFSRNSMFGARTAEKKNSFAINSVARDYIRYDFGYVETNTSYKLVLNKKIKFSNTTYPEVMTIDGISIRATYNTFTATRNLWLFCYNASDNFNTSGLFQFYYFSIWESGEPVRNFIPCKNPQNVVGMYDTVGKQFYSSPNGNAFVAGPEV